MEVGLTWGRKDAPFIFPSPIIAADGAAYQSWNTSGDCLAAHGKTDEQTRARRAIRTDYSLLIQGNPKADFLE
jgi:hypothetical protein